MSREEIEQGFADAGRVCWAMEEEQQAALVFYCECGHKMWCEVRRLEEDLGALAFFDDEEASESYDEWVDRCPGCGRLPMGQILMRNRHSNR